MKQVTEAIILAGGLGTRLRTAVPDLPKCMAPVAGKPFLSYVISYLQQQGITHFIFSLGYMQEHITSYLAREWPQLHCSFAVEAEPLGTGGAIKLAAGYCTSADVAIVNGDTLFEADLPAMYQFHLQQQADCTLALKPMQQFDRYGAVETDAQQRITSFREKQWYGAGLINGGVYLLHLSRFRSLSLPEKFSFEKQYLEAKAPLGALYGFVCDAYFIDIGIPADYERAQSELATANSSNQLPDGIDASWTLFLDRDGVINRDVVDDYVKSVDEFIFNEGACEAIVRLNNLFGRIIVVSNQRGVGKGLMSEEDLKQINNHMLATIQQAGGRIDAVYYCTAVDKTDVNRKPNPGMAWQAKAAFPEIEWSKSMVAGNMPGDMQFGRNIGAVTVYLPTRPHELPAPGSVDAAFKDLLAFALFLESRAKTQ